MTKITSHEGFFGSTNYYDENGHKIGHTEPGFFGGTKTVFDKKR